MDRMTYALDEEEGVRAAYRAYGAELFGFACRSLGDHGLAEEAVQETFLRAWRAADRFDPAIAPLRTWLYSIMRNVVIDLTRARAVRPAVSSGAPAVEQGADAYESALVSWQVEEGLRRLGEDHRRILLETYYRSRPYAEVATELGIPEGTVKSRVYYALRALRLALEEMGWDG
ncbi:MAG: sigma-70 family RNA polymerase sigma factor [Actinobacteria bacterium]|nr:MAG: sigma-70 family RNA polymerase sigma factor [Actinomycetota bacterium]